MDMWLDEYEYDICWCADSDKCKNYECFRHMAHRPVRMDGCADIFTCGRLMGTEYCELTKEGED